jgi:hypothetical protein
MVPDTDDSDESYFESTEKLNSSRPRSADLAEINNLATIWGLSSPDVSESFEAVESVIDLDLSEELLETLGHVLPLARAVSLDNPVDISLQDPETWTSVFTPLHLRPGEPEAIAVLASPNRWQLIFADPSLARKLAVLDPRPESDVLGRMFEAFMIERAGWPDDVMLVLSSDGAVVQVRWT